MKLNQKIFFAVVLVVGIMIWYSFSQDGVGDLAGDFEEVTSYRNENNTGPIRRVYVVTVSDTLWTEMEAYGNYQLHTKFGNTKVLFFKKGSPIPESVKGSAPFFASKFNEFCLGMYEKNTSGLVRLSKYPFH